MIGDADLYFFAPPKIKMYGRIRDLQNNPVYGVLLTPDQALDNIEAALLVNQFEMMYVQINDACPEMRA